MTAQLLNARLVIDALRFDDTQLKDTNNRIRDKNLLLRLIL